MEAGESYQIKLKPDSESQQLWWSHGRKWQVLRWSSWPFGKPFNIYDFVCSHKGRDTLAPVQFSSDAHCIVKTLPWHESHAKEWNEVLALDKNRGTSRCFAHYYRRLLCILGITATVLSTRCSNSSFVTYLSTRTSLHATFSLPVLINPEPHLALPSSQASSPSPAVDSSA